MAPPKPWLNQNINTQTQILNTPAEAIEVIQFWHDAGAERWFAKDDAFDAEIRRRFLPLLEQASTGDSDDWSETPDGTLALMILLDQFSRNLFRGTPRAFANDARARRIAAAAIEEGFDQQLDPVLRQFVYLPFMHSEILADQELSLQLYHALDPLIGGQPLPSAIDHHAIVERFGRFPHRNAVLGRATTAEEQTFLDGGGFKG